MSDNLVDRIRAEAKEMTTLGQALDMLHVADKIEAQQAEIERLRSALDAEGNEANLLMLEIERLREQVQYRDDVIAMLRGEARRG